MPSKHLYLLPAPIRNQAGQKPPQEDFHNNQPLPLLSSRQKALWWKIEILRILLSIPLFPHIPVITHYFPSVQLPFHTPPAAHRFHPAASRQLYAHQNMPSHHQSAIRFRLRSYPDYHWLTGCHRNREPCLRELHKRLLRKFPDIYPQKQLYNLLYSHTISSYQISPTVTP